MDSPPPGDSALPGEDLLSAQVLPQARVPFSEGFASARELPRWKKAIKKAAGKTAKKKREGHSAAMLRCDHRVSKTLFQNHYAQE